MADPVRIFFDADALIAGVHSPTGGAGELLRAVARGDVVGIVSPQVLAESERNIAEKVPTSLERFARARVDLPFEETTHPTAQQLEPYALHAHVKDVPVLAAAHRAEAAYLVTFNLRHYRVTEILYFFTDPATTGAASGRRSGSVGPMSLIGIRSIHR